MMKKTEFLPEFTLVKTGWEWHKESGNDKKKMRMINKKRNS